MSQSASDLFYDMLNRVLPKRSEIYRRTFLYSYYFFTIVKVSCEYFILFNIFSRQTSLYDSIILMHIENTIESIVEYYIFFRVLPRNCIKVVNDMIFFLSNPTPKRLVFYVLIFNCIMYLLELNVKKLILELKWELWEMDVKLLDVVHFIVVNKILK